MAITQQQLEQAEEKLRQISEKVGILRECVQIARQGVAGLVTLTSAQVQALKDKYTVEKADLATLYNQLP